MRTTKLCSDKLPGRFLKLVELMPPRAIEDDAQYVSTLEMIDRLMGPGKLTKGQESYLETLVQLVQAYESSHHAIETPGTSTRCATPSRARHDRLGPRPPPRRAPQHGLEDPQGERSVTVDHLKVLAERFKVWPDTFMD